MKIIIFILLGLFVLSGLIQDWYVVLVTLVIFAVIATPILIIINKKTKKRNNKIISDAGGFDANIDLEYIKIDKRAGKWAVVTGSFGKFDEILPLNIITDVVILKGEVTHKNGEPFVANLKVIVRTSYSDIKIEILPTKTKLNSKVYKSEFATAEKIYRTLKVIAEENKEKQRKLAELEKKTREEALKTIENSQASDKQPDVDTKKPQPPKNWKEFEADIASLLKRTGFKNIEMTKHSNDDGADVVAEKLGVRYVIQCKYYSSTVGKPAVQEVLASMRPYKAQVAIVATNSTFTPSAANLASENGVILWDKNFIEKLKQELSAEK